MYTYLTQEEKIPRISRTYTHVQLCGSGKTINLGNEPAAVYETNERVSDVIFRLETWQNCRLCACGKDSSERNCKFYNVSLHCKVSFARARCSRVAERIFLRGIANAFFARRLTEKSLAFFFFFKFSTLIQHKMFIIN